MRWRAQSQPGSDVSAHSTLAIIVTKSRGRVVLSSGSTAPDHLPTPPWTPGQAPPGWGPPYLVSLTTLVVCSEPFGCCAQACPE